MPETAEQTLARLDLAQGLQSAALYAIEQGDHQQARTLIHALDPIKYFPDNPTPVPTPTARPFGVWGGTSTRQTTVEQLAADVKRLVPAGDWSAVCYHPKAGEGGTWQYYLSDHTPLGLSDAHDLAEFTAAMLAQGISVVPYIVIRGHPAWNGAEWLQAAQIAKVCGKVILNLEEGPLYWNGAKDATGINRYLDGMLAAFTAQGVSGAEVEICAIPRQWVVNALGGNAAMRAWLGHPLITGASWECYEDAPAPDLAPARAIPLVDAWAPNGEQRYRIPLLQQSMLARYANSAFTASGAECWWIGGN